MNIQPQHTYFKTPELTHRIELILHLLEYSNHLIIIKGDKDIGKTSLCNELETQEQSSLILKKLIGNATATQQHVLEVILDISSNNETEPAPTLSDLEQWLARCESKQQIPALLIDDTDLLSDEVFSFLFEKINSQNQQPILHLCLFCEPSFLDRLAELGIEESDNRSLHIIEMPSFSEKQTIQYIHHRYTDDLIGENKLYDDKTIKQIHRISHGLPGRINLLAEQYRQDPVEKQDKEPQRSFKLNLGFLSKYKMIGMVTLALVLLSIGMTSLLYRTETETAKQTIKLDLPKQEHNAQLNELKNIDEPEPADIEPEPVSIEQLSTPVIPELAEDAKSDIAMDIQAEDVTEPILSNIEMAMTSPPQESKNEIVLIDETKTTSVVEEVDTEEQITLEAGQEEKLTSPDPVVEELNDELPVNDNDWLSKQDDSHYVIQLIGANEKQTIDFYLRSFSGNTDDIIELMTTNKGKPWHVLIYGIYDDRDKAAEAITALPERARKMAPWPRSIKSLKELLAKPSL